VDDQHWIHGSLLRASDEVYGIDLDFDPSKLTNPSRYRKASAEDFDFEERFDVIFASEVIEHLSNPGLFLASCARNLRDGGRLMITTPNCFNLYNIAEKFSKSEPTVNKDHTCYFNSKTLLRLLAKNGWEAEKIAFIYSLDIEFKESWKKKVLNVLYAGASRFTPKFLETLVVVAKRRQRLI